MRRLPVSVGLLVVSGLTAFACAPAEEASESDAIDVERGGGAAGIRGEGGANVAGRSGGAGSSGNGTTTGGSSAAGEGGQSGGGGVSGNTASAGTGGTPAKAGNAGASGSSAGVGGTNNGKAGSAGQAPVGGAAGSSTIPNNCARCPLGATCDAGICVCPPGLIAEADGCKKSCAGGEACPPFSTCGGGVCRCDAGAIAAGAGCWPEEPGEPTTHEKADVCAVYKWGMTSVRDARPEWTKGPTACDPGTIPGWVRADVSNRLSMYRWFVGRAPALLDPAAEARGMACGAASSWNFDHGHSIPAGAKCYTPDGAMGAATSNIAYGSLGTAAIDAWVDDRGDVSHTFGHRFSVLAAGATSVGFGHYGGGGDYGGAACLSSGYGGPLGAFPPAGIVPVGIATMPWTIGGVKATKDSVATVTEKASGKSLAVAIGTLGTSGSAKIYLERKGWEPKAGVRYVIKVTAATAPVEYEMEVVACP